MFLIKMKKYFKTYFNHIFLCFTYTVLTIAQHFLIKKKYIFLSVFPLEKPNEFIKGINDNKQFIRGKLGSRIKNQFRKVPKLIFFLDDSAEFSNEIEELIKK